MREIRKCQTVHRISKRLFILFVIILAGANILVFNLKGLSPYFFENSYDSLSHHYAEPNQYALLGDSLIHGHFWLDLPVPDALNDLDNPYSIEERLAIGNDTDVPIFWDHALYEGKYYCYFGVVPAALIYVPYQLLFGGWLLTPYAVLFLGVLFIVSSALLVYRISSRYFSCSATTLTAVVCLLMVVGGSDLAYLEFVPMFYSVPILSSMVLTALGFWFWAGAARKNKVSPAVLGGEESVSGAGFSWKPLALGAFCIALNLGCRPQFVLAGLLALPLFGGEILKAFSISPRRGFRAVLPIVIPVVLVFSFLLAYNYMRFGSLFDFGSNYNLTGFDMAAYHQSWFLTPILLFFYLVQPLNISSQFPFVLSTDCTFPFGWAPSEPMFGGYFMLSPFAFLAFFPCFVRENLKQKKLWIPCLMLLALACAVLIVDARVAGLTQRYFADIGCFLMYATSIVFLSLQEQYRLNEGCASRKYSVIFGFVIVALVFSFFIGLFSFLSPDRYSSLMDVNPGMYSYIQKFFD